MKSEIQSIISLTSTITKSIPLQVDPESCYDEIVNVKWCMMNTVKGVDQAMKAIDLVY